MRAIAMKSTDNRLHRSLAQSLCKKLRQKAPNAHNFMVSKSIHVRRQATATDIARCPTAPRSSQLLLERTAMGNEDINLAPNATGIDRIDTSSDEALRLWAGRLNATADQIRQAVAEVGDRASDVELHLKGSRSTTNDDRINATR
jgi:hypothetical protein